MCWNSLALQGLEHLQERMENVLQRPPVDVSVCFFDRLDRVSLVSTRSLECQHVRRQPYTLDPFFILRAYENAFVDSKRVPAGDTADAAHFPRF